QPPQNTHEILDPADYLKRTVIPSLPLPDLHDVLGKGYEKYDVGSVGEFDVSIILKQFSDNSASAKIASAWRGGSYYAARRSDGSKPAIATGDLAILYLSRWDSDTAAQQFAQVYRASLSKRYKRVENAQCQPAERCDRAIISTEEGPVIIEHLPNSMVLITEGFEPALQQQLKAKLQSGSEKRVARHGLVSRFAQSALLQNAMRSAVLNSAVRAISLH